MSQFTRATSGNVTTDRAIQELQDEVRRLRLELDRREKVANGADSGLREELARRLRKPTTLDFNDVFRGAGDAHALGYVPDPGPYAGAATEYVLTADGTWRRPLDGLVVALLGGEGGTSLAQDRVNVLGALSVASGLSADSITARAFVMQEAHGGTIVNPNGLTATINVIAWQAPYACTVQRVQGYRVGGTSASINARRNGTDNHLSSALSLTSTDAWMDGGVVQNTAYAADDKLEIMLTAVGGSPTQIGVQVTFVRAA